MNGENLREIETKTLEIVKTKKNETKNREEPLFLHFLQQKKAQSHFLQNKQKNKTELHKRKFCKIFLFKEKKDLN